jgi:hypothetical protein
MCAKEVEFATVMMEKKMKEICQNLTSQSPSTKLASMTRASYKQQGLERLGLSQQAVPQRRRQHPDHETWMGVRLSTG